MDDLLFSCLPLSFLAMKVRYVQYALKISHLNGVLVIPTAVSYIKPYTFFLKIKCNHGC